MNIVNRALTLNQNVGNDVIECIAGCTVELTAFEVAGLAVPLNPGYTLSCVLEANDPGSDSDEVRFTFPLPVTFDNPLKILDSDDIFRATVGTQILNEDANGADEIRARFTLVNNSTGRRVIRRSASVTIVL
jgi:hypothetical protein